MEAITKVFQSGNSQAIRIPKEFRLDTDKVKIFSVNGYFVIKPIKKNVRKGWNEAFKKMRENNDDILLIDDVFEDDIDV